MRVGLGRAGQLQRHQEVRRRAHAAGQAVGHVEHGRAGPRRRTSAMWSKPSAKAPSTVSVPPKRTPPNIANCAAPLQQQPHHLQEVLVPAHGDAVLGHAAEAGHHPRARAARAARSTSRIGRERHARAVGRRRPRSPASSGSIFSPSMPTTAWPSLIRWWASVKPAGPRPTTSTRLPLAGLRQRPAQVERVPARQQRIDLEAPGQRQHVLQRAGLDLRDVDRVLLLVDARLHAVVADAVAGGGAPSGCRRTIMASAPIACPRSSSF